MHVNTNSMTEQQERRQHIRFQLRQQASLSVGNSPPIACEIQDYCLGGLFLKLAVPERDTDLLRNVSTSSVEVVFTLRDAVATKTFHIPVQIRRTLGSGVGVAFEKQPVEALRALQKQRMESQKSRIAANLPGNQNQDLRTVCKKLLEDALYQAQERFSQLIEERLTGEANHASSFGEHGALMDAIPEFKRHQPMIREKFIQITLSAPEKGIKAKTVDDPQELSLVKEQDFEDWLAATAEGNKLVDQLRVQLSVIEPGLQHLFGLQPDNSDNSFWPTTICNAYRTALVDVPLSTRIRFVAYGCLREALAEELEPLYAKLQELLPREVAGQGSALSSASPYAQGGSDMPGTEGRERSHAGHAAAESVAQADYLDSQGIATSGSTAVSRSSGAFGRMAGALMDLFKRSGNERAAAHSSQQGGPATRPGASGHPYSGAEFSPAESALPGSNPPGLVTQAGSASHATNMGNTVLSGAPSVLQRLAAQDALPKSGGPAVQRSVNLFGMLFDTVYAEKSLPEEAKPYIERLESNLVKLAAADPEFLNSPNHPAHRVLNTIDRLTQSVADDGKIKDERLVKLINHWTERIKNEAGSNPGIYEEARMALEVMAQPLLKARLARISRLQEMCEGRQLAGQARLRIRQELDEKIGGQTIAKPILDLIVCGWHNYIHTMELRGGRQSLECQKSWKVLDNLLQWLSPVSSAAPSSLQAQQLLHFVDKGLSRVCIEKAEQDHIVDKLADSLMVPGATKQLGHIKVIKRSATRAATRLPDADALAVRQLGIGDWFKFASSIAPLNLVWIGENPAVYVFANYSGIRKLELEQDEFLQMLQSGAAERTEDVEMPLIDRSYSCMVQQMHRKLAWQATHDPVTGLPNQSEFLRGIRRYWLRMGMESPGMAIAVLEFSPASLTNSPSDPEKLNQQLREWILWLQEKLGKTTLLARTSSRTFAFLTSIANSESALDLTHKLIEEFEPFCASKNNDRIVAYCGLTWSADCLDPDTLYKNAEAAQVSARQTGPNQVVLFRDNAAHSANRKSLSDWSDEIGDILGQNRLSLTCQAISLIADPMRTPTHYEILLRSNTTHGEILNIAEFISAVERTKRMIEVDRWVVTQVFDWIRAFPETFSRIQGFSINLSGQSVNSEAFLEFLLEELAVGDIPGEKIIFEITETAAIDSFSLAQQFIRQIRRFGCRFSLDDFGVGFCSYTYLKNLKVDYLKIDGSFVKDIVSSEIDATLVASMKETSSFLGIKTIAEYVENDRILAKLEEIGVDYAQGYHIGKPVPIAELIQTYSEQQLARVA